MACHTWIARRLRRHTMTLGYGGAYGQNLLRRMSAIRQTADGIRRLPQGRIAANEIVGMIRTYEACLAPTSIALGFL
jgi:hypothetical protein